MTTWKSIFLEAPKCDCHIAMIDSSNTYSLAYYRADVDGICNPKPAEGDWDKSYVRVCDLETDLYYINLDEIK